MLSESQSLRLSRIPDILSRVFIHLFLLVVGLLCLLPMWLVVSYSFSDDVLVAEQGVALLYRPTHP